ncbi:MAG: nitrilase family protein [Candidatus Bathyarchaeota archaeon]|nr:nitrilase family protein [Candidatus Bathyarchaeota archaeon]
MSGSSEAESLITIACCQIEPHVGEKDENVEKTLMFANEAIDQGAYIVLLPELANTGYMFNTRKEAFNLAEVVPGGETTRRWEELAQDRGVYLVAGIAEREGYSLYNTSVLIGPDGFIGSYRKLHLWNREKLFFEPGDLGLPVFHTPIGRLGMIVCYDMWFPELIRIYALQGADLILNVTNWVAGSEAERDSKVTEAVCVAQAHLSSVFVAAADRIGVERDQPFLGRSMIVSPTGEVLAGPASFDEEEIIYADCNLSEARRRKRKTRLNHVVHDRRTDIYDVLLGYDEEYRPSF